MKNALPKKKKLLNSLLCGKKYNHLKNNYFLSMRRVSKIWVYTCAFTVEVLIAISPWFFTWHANPYYKWVGKYQWYFYVLAWHKWLASSKGHLWFITEISVIQSSTIQGWFSFLLWPSHFLLDTADLEKTTSLLVPTHFTGCHSGCLKLCLDSSLPVPASTESINS